MLKASGYGLLSTWLTRGECGDLLTLTLILTPAGKESEMGLFPNPPNTERSTVLSHNLIPPY